MTTLIKQQSRMLARPARPPEMMTEAEARHAVESYRDSMARAEAHLISARAMLLELHDREGWKALGYETWRACAVAELGISQAHVYRLLTAAEVERDIRPVIGDFSPSEKSIPERTLRPLAELETAEERRVAWDIAEQVADTEPVTAKHTQYAAGLIVGQRSDPHKPDPKLPPAPACDSCGAPSTNKRNIGGLLAYRCDACTITAAEQEHADQAEAVAGGVSPELVALCEQAEALGAQINYLALNDGAIVRVVPPPGYQQTPLDCDAADLRMLVGKWTHHAAPKAKPGRKGRAWWECAEQLQAVEAAVKNGDQLMAVRGAARLTIALAGDATRLALVQAPKAAELLEQEGHASIAALLRLFIAEEN